MALKIPEYKELTVVVDGVKNIFSVMYGGNDLKEGPLGLIVDDSGDLRFTYGSQTLRFRVGEVNASLNILEFDHQLVIAAALCLMGRTRLRNIVLSKYAQSKGVNWEWMKQVETKVNTWVYGNLWKW